MIYYTHHVKVNFPECLLITVVIKSCTLNNKKAITTPCSDTKAFLPLTCTTTVQSEGPSDATTDS